MEHGPEMQKLADQNLRLAEEAEHAAADSSDPDVRRAFEDMAADLRGVARGAFRGAAIVDDPAAVEAWVRSLKPEHRQRLMKRLRDAGAGAQEDES